MKRLGFGLLFTVVGYVLGVIAGYFLIDNLSTNTHDRSVEAAMTSAFVIGPLAAIIGGITGVIRGGRK